MVYIPRYKAADETPEFTRQDIRLAIHSTDDIPGLQTNPFDLIGINHPCSLIIIRKKGWFVSVKYPHL